MTEADNASVYSSNRLHNGSYLCYINGIEVPVQTVSVRYGVWQIPEASIEMIPDPILQRIGAEDRLQVAIFYLDDFLSEKEEDTNWCLLFEGEVVSWGYRITSGSRNITLTAVNQIAIFTQLFVHFLTNLDDVTSAAVGEIQNNSATITVADSEITFPVSLFTQGLVDPTKSKPIKRPYDYMYNIIKAMIGKFDFENLAPSVRDKVRRQKSVPAANFFTRWARVTNFHNRFVATPIFDETDKDAIFPILQAFQKTVAIDTIIKSILPRIQESGSMWDMLKMVYETVYMEVCMIPTAPFVRVNLADGTIIPTNINNKVTSDTPVITQSQEVIEASLASAEEQLITEKENLQIINKSIATLQNSKQELLRNKQSVPSAVSDKTLVDSQILSLQQLKTSSQNKITRLQKDITNLNNQLKTAKDAASLVVTPIVDYDPQKPWRILNYFAKPQLLFGLPPSCNVIFPSQIESYEYRENYATQPTRLYFNDTVIPDIIRMAGNVRTTALSALAIAYPPEADLYNKQRIINNQAGASGKNFLLFPEEFFKGPVEDRRMMPAWFFMLQQHEKTVGDVEQTASETASTNALANSASAVQLVTESNENGFAVGKIGETTFEGPLRILRPYALSKGVANDSTLRRNVEDATAGKGIPVTFALAWIDQESGGNNLGDSGAPGPRTYHTSETILELPWRPINEQAIAAGKPAKFKIGSYKYDPSFQSPLDEHGYFQISYDESKVLGLTDAEHEKILIDPVFSIQTGVKLIQRYQSSANAIQQQYQISFTGKDYWKLVKAFHSLPSGLSGALEYATAQLNRPPENWDEMLEIALSSAQHTPKSGPGGNNIYSPKEGVVWNANLKRNTTWPVRLLNADRVGNFAATTPDEAAAVTNGTSISSQSNSTDATKQAEQTLIKTSDITDEEKPSTVYQLYAEYEFFRERYSQREGAVITAFNPYVLPGFPGMIFDSRAAAVDVFCYFTMVQHTLSQRGHSTSISFSFGRTFSEVTDLLKTKFDNPVNAGSQIALAPREPIPEIRNVIQQFIRAEEFYNALFYKRTGFENKLASFWWPEVVGYETFDGQVENIFIDGITNAQSISSNEQFSALDSERIGLVALLNKNMDLRNLLVQQFSALNQALASITDVFIRDNTVNAMSNLQNQIDLINLEIKKIQSRIDEIDLALGQDTGKLVKHNLDPLRTISPLPATEALFDKYDAAMAYNWRPICTLEEYIAFYNSQGENLVPAYGTPLSVGKQFYERIRRLKPLTADTILPTGADGITLATFGNQAKGQESTTVENPAEANDPGSARSVRGNKAIGLGKDFPQTRADWDSALLAYRDNVYNVTLLK